MTTVRIRLYRIINQLYPICCWVHSRTPYIINFFKHIIIDDYILLDFFTNCVVNDTHDPRGNKIFIESYWPDLNCKTKDDDNQTILTLLKTYENDIPMVINY